LRVHLTGRKEKFSNSSGGLAYVQDHRGQYALGGLTALAVWLFVVLPLLHYFGDGWMAIVSTIVTASAGIVVAWFTVVLAGVGKQQVDDTRILQRAYLSVEFKGIDWDTRGALYPKDEPIVLIAYGL